MKADDVLVPGWVFQGIIVALGVVAVMLLALSLAAFDMAGVW